MAHICVILSILASEVPMATEDLIGAFHVHHSQVTQGMSSCERYWIFETSRVNVFVLWGSR